jgi:hypothetical protein
VDFYRRGRAAARYKEYAFIWLTGLIGCLAGGTADLITSSISPSYFTLGKGLPAGDGFRLRAVLFGVQEGLSAGVIAGAVCIYAARRKSKSSPLGFAQVLALLWMPIIGAAAGALLLPLAAGRFDPAGLALKMDGALRTAEVIPFVRVWWIHTGLYGGLLAGLLWLIGVVVRRRRAGAKPATAT